MDVDALFPNLSSLVQAKTKKTFCQQGIDGKPENDDYWNLKSSCWSVLTDEPKWKCGPHQTLKTFDEFIRLLPPDTYISKRKSIANKICSSPQGSQFLDTLVEAVWALHYWPNGTNVSLEEPLTNSGKDADIVVVLDGTKYWLDATSVKLSTNKFPIRTSKTPFNELMSVPSNSHKEDVLAELAHKAKEKYQDKFGKGVRSGLFNGEAIGILLCVVKSEDVVLHNFNYGNPPAPPTPEGLFDDESLGLSLVNVHTFESYPNSDILHPKVLADWRIK